MKETEDLTPNMPTPSVYLGDEHTKSIFGGKLPPIGKTVALKFKVSSVSETSDEESKKPRRSVTLELQDGKVKEFDDLDEGKKDQVMAKSNRVPIDVTNYESVKTRLDTLVGVIKDQDCKVESFRRSRFQDIDVKAKREAGELAKDEMFCPVRLINTNILREQTEYVSFISQSRRVAILRAVEDPAKDCSLVERDFTDRVRYPNWMKSRLCAIDSMQQNGRGFLEVLHDSSKPGHFTIAYIPFEDLAVFGDTTDLQSCELILVRHKLTATTLRYMANKIKRLDSKAVGKILDESEESTKLESLYTVYKVFMRKEGLVHVAWASMDKLDNWLGDPRPLYLGKYKTGNADIDPLTGAYPQEFETSYPIFCYDYTINENLEMSAVVGRAQLDRPIQDAATTLLSSNATSHGRASGFYWTKGQNTPGPDDSNIHQQEKIVFQAGSLIPAYLQSHQLKAPDSSMLSAIQALITQNAQETSKINFSAQNRVDSRKTATEIAAATNESTKLSSTKIYLFSSSENLLLNLCFAIYQSRVIAGQLLVSSEIADHLKGYTYFVKPAGDTDVIEKAEKVVKMQQTWPVIQQTPAADIFLKKLIRTMFPEDALEYEAAMEQGLKEKNVIMALATLMKELLTPELLAGMPPEQLQKLQALQAQVQQVTQQPVEMIGPPPPQPKIKDFTMRPDGEGGIVGQTIEKVAQSMKSGVCKDFLKNCLRGKHGEEFDYKLAFAAKGAETSPNTLTYTEFREDEVRAKTYKAGGYSVGKMVIEELSGFFVVSFSESKVRILEADFELAGLFIYNEDNKLAVLSLGFGGVKACHGGNINLWIPTKLIRFKGNF